MNNPIDLQQLVRPNILALSPYRSARDDFDSGTLLDANENAFGAPFNDDRELNRYPMPYQEKLRSLIADFRKVQEENVFVGVGSDEAIDLLYRIFCVPGDDHVLITPPTYGMYKVSATINDIQVDEALLTPDFQLDVEKTISAITEKTKLIFLCSPNNPTGNALNRDDIITIADHFSGIVVVDEAYIDFHDQPGFSEEVLKRPNLVVLQTLSKSFGLAGIRLGIALAPAEIIELMMKVKAPYNVNKLTSEAAIRAFSNLDTVQEKVSSINSERTRVIDFLTQQDQVEKVYPTDANFVLFRTPNAYEVYQKLAASGVVIRYRGNEPHCEDCLRITIGTPDENESFFKEFGAIVANL